MNSRILKPVFLIAIVALGAIGGLGLIVRNAAAVSPNPNARNVNSYFHYANTPVFVGGTMSHYVMNTTARFQATNNSVMKQLSQPRLELDFFLYPNLAGPVSFNGTWQLIIWANASALKPGVWNTEYQEVSPGGSIVWDSGLLNPAVIGGPATNNGYLSVAIYAYNLSDANLAHTFSAGDSVRAAVISNIGSTVNEQFWYDSKFFPSQAIFPSVPTGQPAEIWTENSSRAVTDAFLATAGLKVLVDTNVTDPFGGYDVNATAAGSKSTMATLTITAPNGTAIVTGQRMTMLSGGPLALNNLLEYNITLPLGMPGRYTVQVTSTDNSGNVEHLSFVFTLGNSHKLGAYILDGQNRPLPGAVLTVWSSSFEVFSGVASLSGTVNGTLVSANYTLEVSWQGVTVYQSPLNFASDTNLVIVTAVYDPVIVLVDDTGAPLSGALISITSPNGTLIPGFITTGANGSITLVEAPAGSWELSVLWKTVSVFTGGVQISSNGPYSVKTMVYQLKVAVDGSTGQSVQGAYVVLYNSNGVVYDFKATDSSGSVTLKVPIGTYTVVGLYSTTYLYTPISTSTNRTGVIVNSSGSLTLTLTNYPPSILSTSAFLVLVLVIVAIAAAIIITYFIMRKRLPKILARFQKNSPSQPYQTEPGKSTP